MARLRDSLFIESLIPKYADNLKSLRALKIDWPYADDDEYALSQLPQPEQKKAWSEHHAHTLLDLFNDLSHMEKRISDADAYACLARLACYLSMERRP